MPVLVKSDILLGDVGDFLGLQEQLTISLATELPRVEAWLLFSLEVNDPVDVEVQDCAHESFHVLQWHLFFTIKVSPNCPPDARELRLV